jgi:4-amino-4-deoxy-L-arabinose transferase-like glycosyltransferase
MRQDRKALIIILSAAALLRLALPLSAWLVTGDTESFTTSDTPTYLEPARNLLSQGAFASAGQPDIFRTPGYPLFLIPGLVIGRVWAVTIGLQIILGCLSVLLVYKISRKIFTGRRTPWVASLCYALEPLSVIYSGKLMSETLFTALVLTALYCMLLYSKSGRFRFLTCSSLAIAAAAYVRPVGSYLFLVLAAAAVSRPPVSFRSVLKGASLILICLALLLPWAFRNNQKAGYTGFSAVSDVNLYFFHLPAVLAHQQGCSYLQCKLSRGMINIGTFYEANPQSRSWDQGRVYRHLRQQAVKGILGDLPYFSYIYLKGIALVIVGPGTGELLALFKARHLGPPDLAYSLSLTVPARQVMSTLLHHLPYLGMGLLLTGFPVFLISVTLLNHRCWLNNRRPAALLLGTIVYFLLLSGGMTASSRFRHPIMPLLCILAAPGLTRLFKLDQQNNPGGCHEEKHREQP